jgi:hypothetical protein
MALASFNTLPEIAGEIEVFDKRSDLLEEKNFEDRSDAIDHLELNVVTRIDGLLQDGASPEDFLPLRRYAGSVRDRLEQVDHQLFDRLRREIRQNRLKGSALWAIIGDYFGPDWRQRLSNQALGYDNLDGFINGLLLPGDPPAEKRTPEPEMVFCQQTPARIIFELAARSGLLRNDVFYDLGSGLGRVVMLTKLLSAAKAKGVEIEPAYCDYARSCASYLGLREVEFMEADARTVAYNDGTVFFMYTPFEGSLLQEVLSKLREDTTGRPMRLYTYGPCTTEVALQPWLTAADGMDMDDYKLVEFRRNA